MGTAVVGGMLASTVLNLFFIPVLYVILSSLLERFRRKPKTPHGGEPAVGSTVPLLDPSHELPPPHDA